MPEGSLNSTHVVVTSFCDSTRANNTPCSRCDGEGATPRRLCGSGLYQHEFSAGADRCWMALLIPPARALCGELQALPVLSRAAFRLAA